MASLNLLFVHEVSYEKKPIFEMQEFPEHLAALGHKVTFLQFDEGYKFWRGKRQPTQKTIPGRVLSETSIKIVTPQQLGIPGLDRIYATLSVWPELDRLLAKGADKANEQAEKTLATVYDRIGFIAAKR